MSVRLLETVDGVESPLVGTFPSELEAEDEAKKRRALALANKVDPRSSAFPRYRIVPA